MSSIVKPTTNLQPKNEVLGVSGSPRKNGNSDILLKNIISGVAHENIPSDALNLTNLQFQGCIGCEKCRKDKICTGLIDGMSVVYNRIISSKGLVLVSPTHNYKEGKSYTISLTVSDDDGDSDTRTRQVVISDLSGPSQDYGGFIIVFIIFAAMFAIMIGFVFWLSKKRR